MKKEEVRNGRNGSPKIRGGGVRVRQREGEGKERGRGRRREDRREE